MPRLIPLEQRDHEHGNEQQVLEEVEPSDEIVEEVVMETNKVATSDSGSDDDEEVDSDDGGALMKGIMNKLHATGSINKRNDSRGRRIAARVKDLMFYAKMNVAVGLNDIKAGWMRIAKSTVSCIDD